MPPKQKASWFAGENPTYPIELVHPATGDKIKVVARRLDGKDFAEVQNVVYDPALGEGDTRRAIVTRAVVSWDMKDVPWTPAMFDQLLPEIMMQLWLGIDERDVNPLSEALRATAPPPDQTTSQDEPSAAAGSAPGDAD
jgi:hypothetical protein